VSTMKAPEALLIMFIFVSFLSFLSCGKKNGSGDDGQDAAVAQGKLSEEKVIEEILNEAITRLRYGDKSGLYENEFEYYTDEVNFDDYLKTAQMHYAQADTIAFVEVRHVEFFDRDSAHVDVTVHFEGPTGQKSFHRDELIVYYHKGRWIKPTISVIDLQKSYEEKIRIADSAATAEAEQTGF